MTAVLERNDSSVAKPGYRPASFGDVLHSEWTKIRTVHSTMWTLITATVLGIGLGALISLAASNQYSKAANVRATWDPTGVSTTGLFLAQLAVAVLGIMFITSEYSTRAIGTSLTAVPRRGRLLAAKAVVIAGISLVVAEILAFVSFFIGQALISGNAPTANLAQPNVLRALVGCGLDGAVIGLVSLSLGALLRSAAGAIAIMVALLYVLPAVASALPSSIEHSVEKFWPTQAGGQLTNVMRASHTLSPWVGFGDFCIFAAILMGAAFYVLDRRDA
jgi:ABC-2 type transport system permease protein